MSKPELLSMQWLSEQFIRVASSESNGKCLPGRNVDQDATLTYANAVKDYVFEHPDEEIQLDKDISEQIVTQEDDVLSC